MNQAGSGQTAVSGAGLHRRRNSPILRAMNSPLFREQLAPIHDLLKNGEVGTAVMRLSRLEHGKQDDALALQQIAEALLLCGQHEAALRCHERSAELRPDDPDILYNLATSRLSHGQLDQAKELLQRVIGLRPDDGGARLALSGLRRATPEHNHVEALQFLRQQLQAEDPGHIPLCYALAKELEDLGRHDEAWRMLQEGAQRRRHRMQYDIVGEETALAEIGERFNAGLFAHSSPGHDDPRPVFILGMPRSGSTLLDRMLSSHSHIGSLGEHNMLVLSLLKAAGDGLSKKQLLQQSVHVNFEALGQAYSGRIDGFGNPAERLIDKTPQNFLYLGLIRLALPKAKIIHMKRNPMDHCYAIYKTLFRAGYPFSYRLQELGRYYIAYTRLMDHWRREIPEAFMEVDYESLVERPETELRRALDYLELDWEDACLDFHRHDGVAATASAAQVRQPLHSRSVGLWRRYGAQLTPFANKLREHGIDI